LPILVPEGTITSALTVYSYTLRETDTFFFIGQISHLFDQYDAEAIILPIATAQTAVLNANNCDVKITAPVQVSGGGFIASISGCRANLHVVLDGLLMEIENDGTVDDCVEIRKRRCVRRAFQRERGFGAEQRHEHPE